jgi:hypothetical protein
VQKGNILIPKGQKERKSVFVYVQYGTIEKVSNFEIAVGKLKETCETSNLPHFAGA